MNKNVILPIVALMILAMVGAASADDEVTTVDKLEIRGTIMELDDGTPTLEDDLGVGVDQVWDYSTFAGFWYDLDDDLETETLTILPIVPAGETNAGDDTLDFDA
ncbi:MAG: hypothetical protein U9N07_05620, partial [Euryarchaeota archaeon]|nr:hypothetical protein [Euryarchaeota archaeon]